jgi:hypothetical protein
MINMRVGGLCGTAHHMRDDCSKQSTLPEESKRGRMKGAVSHSGGDLGVGHTTHVNVLVSLEYSPGADAEAVVI